MSKFFKIVRIVSISAIVGAIVGILIYINYVKVDALIIDSVNIPTELEQIEAKPDTVFEIIYFENIDKVKYLEKKLRKAADDLAKQLRNKKTKIPKNTAVEVTDTTKIEIKSSWSSKVFYWDENLEPIRDKNWFVEVKVGTKSITPVDLYRVKPNIKWLGYYEKFYLPQVEKTIYNQSAVGLIKGVAGTAALFSGDKYVASTGLFVIVDEVFEFGVIDFIYNIF